MNAATGPGLAPAPAGTGGDAVGAVGTSPGRSFSATPAVSDGDGEGAVGP